jgi:hypothetical protein
MPARAKTSRQRVADDLDRLAIATETLGASLAWPFEQVFEKTFDLTAKLVSRELSLTECLDQGLAAWLAAQQRQLDAYQRILATRFARPQAAQQMGVVDPNAIVFTIDRNAEATDPVIVDAQLPGSAKNDVKVSHRAMGRPGVGGPFPLSLTNVRLSTSADGKKVTVALVNLRRKPLPFRKAGVYVATVSFKGKVIKKIEVRVAEAPRQAVLAPRS